MKRIGSGQLMVTEADKIVLPSSVGLIGASRLAPPQAQHQQLLLHSIQEDGSSQVCFSNICFALKSICNTRSCHGYYIIRIVSEALLRSIQEIAPLWYALAPWTTLVKQDKYFIAVHCYRGQRFAPPQAQHQQLILHSIQEDGSSQVGCFSIMILQILSDEVI